MKTSQLVTLVLTLVQIACGGVIPSAYRGQFVDGPSGARLDLQKETGTLMFADGRVGTANAKELSFEDLRALQAGIYVDLKPKNAPKNTADVYWIAPTGQTHDVGGGLIHVEAEVILTHMRMDLEEPVPGITLAHCMRGSVMLDTSKNRWQAACGGDGTTYFDFKRVESQ